ncbi:hypothetical protein SUGI_0505980 [Cryptomeria japonica]|nr:hypothetical protein SUGI_0505980 [Cryptomeria japonica]
MDYLYPFSSPNDDRKASELNDRNSKKLRINAAPYVQSSRSKCCARMNSVQRLRSVILSSFADWPETLKAES